MHSVNRWKFAIEQTWFIPIFLWPVNAEMSEMETHLGLDAGIQNIILATNEEQTKVFFLLYLSLKILFQ